MTRVVMIGEKEDDPLSSIDNTALFVVASSHHRQQLKRVESVYSIERPQLGLQQQQQ